MNHCKDCGMPLDGSDPNPLRMVWAAVRIRMIFEWLLFCSRFGGQRREYVLSEHCSGLIEKYTFDPQIRGMTKH